MLNKCAILLTNQLNKNMILTSEEKEIHIYGLELLLSILFTMVLIFTISFLSKNIIYAILFVLFFFLPRLFCGGVHAKTHFRCTFMTITIFISIIYISKKLYFLSSFFIIVVVTIALIIMIKFSPIVNPNHPISDKTYKKNRVASIIISIIDFSTIICLYCKTNNEITLASASSFIWVAILLMIEKINIKVKGVKQ